MEDNSASGLPLPPAAIEGAFPLPISWFEAPDTLVHSDLASTQALWLSQWTTGQLCADFHAHLG